MEGNTLFLPDKQLFVDEACSGIVSVMSSVACAVVYSVWQIRPPIHLVLLALASVVWATLMNVVRICAITIVHNRWGVDWSECTLLFSNSPYLPGLQLPPQGRSWH